jgi:hypothetical protein
MKTVFPATETAMGKQEMTSMLEKVIQGQAPVSALAPATVFTQPGPLQHGPSPVPVSLKPVQPTPAEPVAPQQPAQPSQSVTSSTSQDVLMMDNYPVPVECLRPEQQDTPAKWGDVVDVELIDYDELTKMWKSLPTATIADLKGLRAYLVDQEFHIAHLLQTVRGVTLNINERLRKYYYADVLLPPQAG